MVRTIKSSVVVLDVHRNSLVLDIKQELYQREEMEPEQQRLIFEGCELEDNRTLIACHIEKGSMLYQHCKLRVTKFHSNIISNKPLQVN